MENDSYKKLAEDLLAYVTKDTFAFVQRYHQIVNSEGGNPTPQTTQKSQLPPPEVREKPKPPTIANLPGAPSAQSFSLEGIVKRAQPLESPDVIIDDDEIPF